MSGGFRAKVVSYTGGQLASQVFVTLLGIYLARTLTLQDLGSYRQVILVVITASGMIALGLPNSVFYFLPRLEDRRSMARFAGQTLLLLTIAGLVSMIAMFLLSPWLAQEFDNPELVGLLKIASPLMVTALLLRFTAPVLLSLDQSRMAGVVRAVQAAMVALAVFALVWAGLSLREVIGGMVLAEIAAVALGLALIIKFLPLRPSFDPASAKEQLVYAIPLGLGGVVGLLSRQIDKFMVSSFFDTETFAVYSIGAVEFPVVPLISSSIAAVVLPELSKSFGRPGHEGFRSLFRRAQSRNHLISVPIVVLTIAVAEPLLGVIYGPDFVVAAWVFRIYGLILINRLFMFGPLYQSMGLSKILFAGEIAFLILNVIGNYFFLRWFGFVGPALATFLAGAVIMTAYSIRLRGVEGIRWVDLYDVGLNLRVGIASATACIPAWLLANRLPHELWALALESVVFLVVLLVAIRAFRAVSPHDYWMLLPWRWSQLLRRL